MSRHKHANLIHQWAEGAKIQYRAVPGYGNWMDAPYHFIWDSIAEYRIKPVEKEGFKRPRHLVARRDMVDAALKLLKSELGEWDD